MFYRHLHLHAHDSLIRMVCNTAEHAFLENITITIITITIIYYYCCDYYLFGTNNSKVI